MPEDHGFGSGFRTPHCVSSTRLLIHALITASWLLSVAYAAAPADDGPLWERCSRFREYERGIAEDLLPWHDSEGISESIIDYAVTQRTLRVGEPGLPFLIRNGSLYIIDGAKHNIRATVEWQSYNVIVYAFAIQRLVARWGRQLPDVEFVIETGDVPCQDLGEHANNHTRTLMWARPHSRLPVMRHCKADSGLDITIPTFHFYTMPFDERFVANSSRWVQEIPFATRKLQAFSAGASYHRHQGVPATIKYWDGKREGKRVDRLRKDFLDYVLSELRHPNITCQRSIIPMGDWTRFQMVMHIDGVTCSSRLPQLLALGSVVLREMSGYKAFYDKLLERFVHYVPFWSHRPREVVWAYNWVASNQEAAARIAANGAAFAREYLNRQAIECYWALLLRQYARLQRFTPGQRGGLPWSQSPARPLDLMPMEEWLKSQEGKYAEWGPNGIAERGKALYLLPLQ